MSIIIAACLLSITGVYAQGPEAIGDGLDGENTSVPFDGGVSILVAAGISYGAKRAYDAKKRNAANDAEVTVGTPV